MVLNEYSVWEFLFWEVFLVFGDVGDDVVDDGGCDIAEWHGVV